MWFLEQLTPGDPAYHMFLVDRLRGPLDLAAVRHAVTAVVARHAILRTRFPAPDGVPVQEVLPAGPVDVEYLDGGDAQVIVAARTNAPFDLAAAPPLRITVVRLGADDHVLCVVLHHLLGDGWSLHIWQRELAAHYTAFLDGTAPDVPALPLQYTDTRSPAWHADYWTEQLTGVPPLDLPTDHSRPSETDSRAGVVSFRIDDPRVPALARKLRATPFMTLFAAFHVLLAGHSGQRDFCVGVPTAARHDVDLEPLIGPFAGVLPLRPDLSGDPTFTELVGRVRKVSLGAFTHPQAPLEELVGALDLDRDLGRNPLYQAVFALHATATGYDSAAASLPGLTVEPFPHGCHRAKVDLALETWPQPTGIHAELTYRLDLFEPATAAALVQRFTRLLSTVVENPDQRLSDLGVTDTLHGPSGDVPDATVADLVVAQAQRTPDAVAVVCGDERRTYADLVRLARRVAAGLDGVSTVAVQLRRSADLVAVLLGVQLAGAAYVPVDPDYPTARIDYMVEDSGADLVLTDDWLSRLGEEEAAGEPGEIAYVIYTSGSTGRPKGVVVPHSALTNLLLGMRDLLGPAPDAVWLAATSLSFDISALELYLPLIDGGRVVIADQDTTRDGTALARLIRDHAVTHVQATPSGWRTLLDGKVGAGLTALVGGEALPLSLARELRARVARMVNLYGPTETTIWSTAWEVPPEPDRVSIGRPIRNTTVTVVDGELVIGGAGVALGYHDRPELTTERFGDRGYRTGDRVRPRNGELEFLGRLDEQVKIRGHRVEPGEVEAVLEAQPGAGQAVVTVRENRLVAYVTGAAEGLRERLADVLPEHLVPDVVVALPTLPLTLNGKVDRKALPDPDHTAGRGGAPRTAAERRVAAVFAEVLDLPDVGVDDDFFALGGHSLLATKVAARLGAIPVRTLFSRPTVAALAAALPEHDEPGPMPRPAGTAPPLSHAQERLWFLHRLDPQDASYTMYLVRRLRGPLDVAAFDRACTAVVARHESLRTRFPEVAGQPVAVVEPPAPVRVEHLHAADAGEARRLVADRVNAPIDLATSPPVRFTLIRLGEDDHVLAVVLHHIMADGWSLNLLLAELSTVYAGGELPPLAVQHGDVAAWKREQEPSLDYWRAQLADPPTLTLPVRDESGPGAFESRRLPAGLVTRLEEVARANGATLFMTLLAAYQALLAHHTGQRDVLVGSPVAGRGRVELEPLIGYLADTVLLRGDVRNESFTALLRRTRDTVLGALAHQDVPLEQLLADLGRPRLLETMCVLHSQDTEQPTFGDLRLEPFDSGYRQAKFDLMLEAWTSPDGLLLAFGYDTGRLDAVTVAAMADRFVTLLTGLVADDRIEMLTDADHALLQAFAAGPESRSDTTVPEQLARAFAAHADRPALVCGNDTLTYAELSVRVDRLAGSLQEDGVRPGDVVGVSLPRSIDAVVTLLAVWRAGAAYLPLDPDLPAARLEFLVTDSGATLVIDERYLVRDRPFEAVDPHDAAYVIYTSGSTGRPKGVVVEHGNLAARVDWMRTDYDLGPADRIVQFASLSFDTHAEELYPALTAGATVILLPGGSTDLPSVWHERDRARPADRLLPPPRHHPTRCAARGDRR